MILGGFLWSLLTGVFHLSCGFRLHHPGTREDQRRCDRSSAAAAAAAHASSCGWEQSAARQSVTHGHSSGLSLPPPPPPPPPPLLLLYDLNSDHQREKVILLLLKQKMSSCLFRLALFVACVLSIRCTAAPGTEAEARTTSRDTCASCGVAQPEDPESGRLNVDFLEAVKRHILSRLQMRERPNITHPVSKASMVTALRKLHAGKLREDGRVEIPNLDGHPMSNEVLEESSEIISFAEKDDMVTSKSSLFFLISSEGNQNLFVTQATLWLYFKLLPSPPEVRPRRKVTVKVYYQEPGLGSKWNLVEKRVELKRSGWHTFVLTDAVRLVFEKGDRRQNLDVRCEACEAEGVVPVLLNHNDESHRPFLVVQARQSDNKHRIRKRGLECDGSSSLCCRQQFYIDFRLIGWNDWIIAPSGYFGNYCEGNCPAYMAGVPGSASSFHTAVVNQYRMRGMSPGSMNSCCIPTKLSTMSMLYFDDEYNIVKRDVPNMIVEECGCA